MSDPFRPSRRRRLLWPLLVSAGALVALAVAMNVGADEAPALYVEDLREQAGRMARKAGTFREMLERMPTVERVELVEIADDIVAAGEQVGGFLEEPAPDPLARSAVVFGLAVESWGRGVAGLRDGLLAAADGPGANSHEPLIDALLDLRSGDRLYLTFLEEVGTDEAGRPVFEMPEVAFVPPGYPITASAQTLAALASAPGSRLELRASLRLQQVTTEPEWVLDTEDRLVVEETSELAVKVIVANRGNIESEPAALTLTLTDAEGVAQETQAPIEALAPGAKTTVTVGGLAVTPGVSYQLVVRLPLAAGEEETEDNARALPFRVNEPTPTTTTTSG